MEWYDETIQTDISAMGFLWSFEHGGWFTEAPAPKSVYTQASASSQWDLALTNWDGASSLLNERFRAYRNSLAYSITHRTPGSVAANGVVTGEMLQVGAAPAFDTFIMYLLTGTPGQTLRAPTKATPPAGAEAAPVYAWMQLDVPRDAVSMAFDFKVEGDWKADSLAAAFNGTNVLLLPGSQIETNVLFSSGRIDVSAFAGQTNEFFVGIVGGTSTNAQLTLENLVFYTAAPPSLHAEVIGSGVKISWPLDAQGYQLQLTTNVADAHSWTPLTNIPTIVNFQNTVTNPIVGGSQFYRLKK
jgi:hypothetical protein